MNKKCWELRFCFSKWWERFKWMGRYLVAIIIVVTFEGCVWKVQIGWKRNSPLLKEFTHAKKIVSYLRYIKSTTWKRFKSSPFFKVGQSQNLIPHVKFIWMVATRLLISTSSLLADLWNFRGIFRNFNISTTKIAKINSTKSSLSSWNAKCR